MQATPKQARTRPQGDTMYRAATLAAALMMLGAVALL